MCVSQFQDYCNAFSFKRRCTLTKNDHVIQSRGTFYNNHAEFLYVEDSAKMKALAAANNPYACK